MSQDSARLEKIKNVLAALLLFFLPLKLSFCYAALLPFLLIWTYENLHNLKSELGPNKNPLLWPLLVFVILCSLSSLFGVNSVTSLRGLVGLLFVSLLIPALCEVGAKFGFLKLIAFLLAGQTLSSFHSMLEDSFGWKNLFLGKVTESGQLALSWLLAFGLLILLRQSLKINENSRQLVYFGLLNLLLFNALAFSNHFGINYSQRYLLLVLSLLVIAYSLKKFYELGFSKQAQKGAVWLLALSLLVMPLLSCALLINLKRGPWAGVFVALLVLLAFTSRKLLAIVVTFAMLLVFFIEPVRTRIEQAPRDFFISGGRSTIWEIGLDLATRYPLGIGYNNSPFLRNYSNQIPKNNTHFHNNFLNILVETGALGFFVFLWWLYVLLHEAWGRSISAFNIRNVLGCAILSWQIAGMVEYNFGDSEVLFLVFVMVALLAKSDQVTKELKNL